MNARRVRFHLRECRGALVGELGEIRVVDVDRHDFEVVRARLLEEGGVEDVDVHVRIELAQLLEVLHRIGRRLGRGG